MTDRDPSSSLRGALRSDVAFEVVNCLDNSFDLRSPLAWQALVSRFEQRSGRRIYPRRTEVGRDWWFEFVGACLPVGSDASDDSPDEFENGLLSLVDAVADLRPDSLVVDQLLRLRDEWEAGRTADEAGTAWELLRRDLTGVPVRRVAGAFRDACHPMPPPRHCRDAWDLFLWTASRAPEPGKLSAHTVFLLGCASVLSPETSVRTDVWLRAEAHRRDGAAFPFPWERRPEQLCGALSRAVVGAQEARGGVTGQGSYVLSLRFHPDGPTPDDHTVSWRLQGPAGGVRDLGAAAVRAPLFEEFAAGVVTAAEEIIDAETPVDLPARLAVEIFLPVTQLFLPVAGWRRTFEGGPRFLIEDHTVVARSLERALRRAPSSRQRRRWAALTGSGRPRIVAVRASELKEFELAANENVTAVVLSGPPVPGSVAARELVHVLREGLGIVAWQDDDVHRQTDRALLALLTGQGLPADEAWSAAPDPETLPGRFREENLSRLRHRLAAAVGAGGDEHVPVRCLATLLWDDLRRDAVARAALEAGNRSAGTAVSPGRPDEAAAGAPLPAKPG